MKDSNEFRSQPPPLRLVERARPNNEHAEQVVLGTLLTFPERIEEVIGALLPSDFRTFQHRVLYEIMLKYYRKHGEAADFLTLAELLRKNNDLDASDMTKLLGLSNEIWSPNLAQDVLLIAGPSAQNRYIDASQKLADIGWNTADPNEARAAVEKLFYELVSDRISTSDFTSLDDVLSDCMNDIETAIEHRGQLLGIPTGFTDIDSMFNGLQRTDLILLAARPGFGKTSLGLGIGYNAAKAGKVVAVFSLEMGKKQLGLRLLSLVSRVRSNWIKSGWLDEEDQEKVIAARDHLGDLPLYIDDTAGTPISSIASKLRRLSARIHRPVDLVIVDYLQLMEDEEESATARDNRNQELSKISRGLKKIARVFNVPVLALAQLSRAVETRQNKRPQLSDLRDSGALEQDADIVMFIYRDEIYNAESESKGYADVIVAKDRNGPTGDVRLRFDPSLTRFDNCEEEPAYAQ